MKAESGQSLSIRNVRDAFFRMEEREQLFDLTLADGTRFWDVIRLNVFYGLYAKLGGPYLSPVNSLAQTAQSRLKDLARVLLNRATRRYIAARRPDIIFIAGQRILAEGRLQDNITDHLIDLGDGPSVVVETMNRDAIDYRRVFLGGPTRIPPVFLSPNYIVHGLEGAIKKVHSILASYFEISVDVRGLIEEPLVTFAQTRTYYQRVFAEHRPRVVILINNGSLKGLFAAANEHAIPTAELQHGASSSDNPFWSYPMSIKPDHPGLSLPTYYLTFADYWRSNSNYPVRQTFAIGNNYFHLLPNPGDNAASVVISAYMYHELLRDVTIATAAKNPEKQFYYKLHPHQFASKNRVIAEFANLPNIEVVSDEITIPALFKICGFVVGIHSTLLYTALQAKKKVCIFKRYNYFWHEDIFPWVEQFDDEDELSGLLSNDDNKFLALNARPSMFDPFDVTRYREVLSQMVGSAA